MQGGKRTSGAMYRFLDCTVGQYMSRKVQTVTRTVTLLPRRGPSGRIDAVREGNTIRATTRRVSAFTILLSPAVFDFSQPIRVVADGRTVFDGRVEKKLATLMKWAARDNDRTMLYGAELTLRLQGR